ncbi:MAG: winged helix-turn-helix domain-containing protein [Wenzhouxiangellaceae bacterium]
MQSYRFDCFEFDAGEGRLVNRDVGQSLRLRPKAAIVLQQLLFAGGDIVERERLREAVWGQDRIVDFEAGLAALMRELRKALHELGGEQDLIETLPRRGYRLRAEVNPVSENQSMAGERASINVQVTARRNTLPIAFIAVVIIAAALVFMLWRHLTDPESEREVILADSAPALAIVPFEVYGETPLLPEHTSILLADTLLAELWRSGPEDLSLLGRIAIQPYLDREDLAAAVAEDLGLTLLLEGTLRAENQRWWLDLRLLRVPPGRVLWSHRIENTARLNIAEVAGNLAEEFKRRWPEIHQNEKLETAD